MKKAILALILLNGFIANTVFSQDDFYTNTTEESRPEKRNIVFLGIGNGVNNHSGIIGALIEIGPIKKASVLGGIGLGGYGVKSAIGVRYYRREFPSKFFYGLTYTSASGFQGYEVELETTRSSNETVEVDLNRAENIAISFGYQWMLFRNGRLNFELGYSVPLQKKAYEVVTSGVELTEDSESQLRFMTPGGIIMGVAFTIGL